MKKVFLLCMKQDGLQQKITDCVLLLIFMLHFIKIRHCKYAYNIIINASLVIPLKDLTVLNAMHCFIIILLFYSYQIICLRSWLWTYMTKLIAESVKQVIIQLLF